MGRRHHYIACCSRDTGKHVRLWQLPAGPEMFMDGEAVDGKEVQPLILESSSSQVRRVEWNVSGTTLATSGDDGEVSLWQCDHFSKQWIKIDQHSVSSVSG
eukprot:TRINITY_DN16195_c0_g1_i1.p1 TRINITY_DN16195_c0_g1~~TRINITY_DN16195_c0_g1_i1.p1  ORF type:complete len:101 (+),score=22.69 TRINITY_DN16195_c0_g1_i1:239-541(+)